ncbi:hypothetical protein C7C45_32445, partial [Micromonospora arborensis]
MVLTAEQLSQILDGVAPEGVDLLLVACGTGLLGDGFAQRLSDVRRVEVLAPPGAVTVGSRDQLAEVLSSGGESWVLFSPSVEGAPGGGWDVVNDLLDGGGYRRFDGIAAVPAAPADGLVLSDNTPQNPGDDDLSDRFYDADEDGEREEGDDSFYTAEDGENAPVAGSGHATPDAVDSDDDDSRSDRWRAELSALIGDDDMHADREYSEGVPESDFGRLAPDSGRSTPDAARNVLAQMPGTRPKIVQREPVVSTYVGRTQGERPADGRLSARDRDVIHELGREVALSALRRASYGLRMPSILVNHRREFEYGMAESNSWLRDELRRIVSEQLPEQHALLVASGDDLGPVAVDLSWSLPDLPVDGAIGALAPPTPPEAAMEIHIVNQRLDWEEPEPLSGQSGRERPTIRRLEADDAVILAQEVGSLLDSRDQFSSTHVRLLPFDYDAGGDTLAEYEVFRLSHAYVEVQVIRLRLGFDGSIRGADAAERLAREIAVLINERGVVLPDGAVLYVHVDVVDFGDADWRVTLTDSSSGLSAAANPQVWPDSLLSEAAPEEARVRVLARLLRMLGVHDVASGGPLWGRMRAGRVPDEYLLRIWRLQASLVATPTTDLNLDTDYEPGSPLRDADDYPAPFFSPVPASPSQQSLLGDFGPSGPGPFDPDVLAALGERPAESGEGGPSRSGAAVAGSSAGEPDPSKGSPVRSMRRLPNGAWLVPPPDVVDGVAVDAEQAEAMAAGMVVPPDVALVVGVLTATGELAARGEGSRELMPVDHVLDGPFSVPAEGTTAPISSPDVLVLYHLSAHDIGRPGWRRAGHWAPMDRFQQAAVRLQSEIDDRAAWGAPVPRAVVFAGRNPSGFDGWGVVQPGLGTVLGPYPRLDMAVKLARSRQPARVGLATEVRHRLARSSTFVGDSILSRMIAAAGNVDPDADRLGAPAYQQDAPAVAPVGPIGPVVRVPVGSAQTASAQLDAARAWLVPETVRQVPSAVEPVVEVLLPADVAVPVLHLPASGADPALDVMTIRLPNGYQRDSRIRPNLWVSGFADGFAAEVLPAGITTVRLLGRATPLFVFDRLFFDLGHLNTQELVELDPLQVGERLPSAATGDAQALALTWHERQVAEERHGPLWRDRWVTEERYARLVQENPAAVEWVVARYPAGSVLWSPRYLRWLTGREYAQLRLPDAGGERRVVVLLTPLSPQAGGDDPVFIRDLSGVNTTVVVATATDEPTGNGRAIPVGGFWQIWQAHDSPDGEPDGGGHQDLVHLLHSILAAEPASGRDLNDGSGSRDEVSPVGSVPEFDQSGDELRRIELRLLAGRRASANAIWRALSIANPFEIRPRSDRSTAVVLMVPLRYISRRPAEAGRSDVVGDVEYLDLDALREDGFSAEWIQRDGSRWLLTELPVNYSDLPSYPDPPARESGEWQLPSMPLAAAVRQLPAGAGSPDGVDRVWQVLPALGVAPVGEPGGVGADPGHDVAAAFGGAFVDSHLSGLADLRPGAITAVWIAGPDRAAGVVLVERRLSDQLAQSRFGGQLVAWNPRGERGNLFFGFDLGQGAQATTDVLPPLLRGPVQLVRDGQGQLRQVVVAGSGETVATTSSSTATLADESRGNGLEMAGGVGPVPVGVTVVSRADDGGWLADGLPVVVRSLGGARGGVALLADDDWRLLADPERLLPDGVRYPVLVHGAGEGVRVPVRHVDGAVGAVSLTAEQLSQILDGVAPEGVDLLLVACGTGLLGDGFAQRLSDVRRVEVLAPPGAVTVGSRDQLAEVLSSGGESWVLFSPSVEGAPGGGWDVVNDELPDGSYRRFDGIAAAPAAPPHGLVLSDNTPQDPADDDLNDRSYDADDEDGGSVVGATEPYLQTEIAGPARVLRLDTEDSEPSDSDLNWIQATGEQFAMAAAFRARYGMRSPTMIIGVYRPNGQRHEDPRQVAAARRVVQQFMQVVPERVRDLVGSGFSQDSSPQVYLAPELPRPDLAGQYAVEIVYANARIPNWAMDSTHTTPTIVTDHGPDTHNLSQEVERVLASREDLETHQVRLSPSGIDPSDWGQSIDRPIAAYRVFHLERAGALDERLVMVFQLRLAVTAAVEDQPRLSWIAQRVMDRVNGRFTAFGDLLHLDVQMNFNDADDADWRVNLVDGPGSPDGAANLPELWPADPLLVQGPELADANAEAAMLARLLRMLGVHDVASDGPYWNEMADGGVPHDYLLRVWLLQQTLGDVPANEYSPVEVSPPGSPSRWARPDETASELSDGGSDGAAPESAESSGDLDPADGPGPQEQQAESLPHVIELLFDSTDGEHPGAVGDEIRGLGHELARAAAIRGPLGLPMPMVRIQIPQPAGQQSENPREVAAARELSSVLTNYVSEHAPQHFQRHHVTELVDGEWDSYWRLPVAMEWGGERSVHAGQYVLRVAYGNSTVPNWVIDNAVHGWTITDLDPGQMAGLIRDVEDELVANEDLLAPVWLGPSAGEFNSELPTAAYRVVELVHDQPSEGRNVLVFALSLRVSVEQWTMREPVKRLVELVVGRINGRFALPGGSMLHLNVHLNIARGDHTDNADDLDWQVVVERSPSDVPSAANRPDVWPAEFFAEPDGSAEAQAALLARLLRMLGVHDVASDGPAWDEMVAGGVPDNYLLRIWRVQQTVGEAPRSPFPPLEVSAPNLPVASELMDETGSELSADDPEAEPVFLPPSNFRTASDAGSDILFSDDEPDGDDREATGFGDDPTEAFNIERQPRPAENSPSVVELVFDSMDEGLSGIGLTAIQRLADRLALAAVFRFGLGLPMPSAELVVRYRNVAQEAPPAHQVHRELRRIVSELAPDHHQWLFNTGVLTSLWDPSWSLPVRQSVEERRPDSPGAYGLEVRGVDDAVPIWINSQDVPTLRISYAEGAATALAAQVRQAMAERDFQIQSVRLDSSAPNDGRPAAAYGMLRLQIDDPAGARNVLALLLRIDVNAESQNQDRRDRLVSLVHEVVNSVNGRYILPSEELLQLEVRLNFGQSDDADWRVSLVDGDAPQGSAARSPDEWPTDLLLSEGDSAAEADAALLARLLRMLGVNDVASDWPHRNEMVDGNVPVDYLLRIWLLQQTAGSPPLNYYSAPATSPDAEPADDADVVQEGSRIELLVDLSRDWPQSDGWSPPSDVRRGLGFFSVLLPEVLARNLIGLPMPRLAVTFSANEESYNAVPDSWILAELELDFTFFLGRIIALRQYSPASSYLTNSPDQIAMAMRQAILPIQRRLDPSAGQHVGIVEVSFETPRLSGHQQAVYRPGLLALSADQERAPGWWRVFEPVRGVEARLAQTGPLDFRQVGSPGLENVPFDGEHVSYVYRDLDLQADVRVFLLRLAWRAGDGVGPQLLRDQQALVQQAAASLNERFRLPGGEQFHLLVVPSPPEDADRVITVSAQGATGDRGGWPAGLSGQEVRVRLLSLLGAREGASTHRAIAQIWVESQTGWYQIDSVDSTSSRHGPVVGSDSAGAGSAELGEAGPSQSGRSSAPDLDERGPEPTLRRLSNGVWLVSPPDVVGGSSVDVTAIEAVTAELAAPENVALIVGVLVEHYGIAGRGAHRGILRAEDLLDEPFSAPGAADGVRVSSPDVLTLYLRGTHDDSRRFANRVQSAIDERALHGHPVPRAVVYAGWGSSATPEWWVTHPGYDGPSGPFGSLRDAVDDARVRQPRWLDLPAELRRRLAGGSSLVDDMTLSSLVAEHAGVDPEAQMLGMPSYQVLEEEPPVGPLGSVRVPVGSARTESLSLDAARNWVRSRTVQRVPLAAEPAVEVSLPPEVMAPVVYSPAGEAGPELHVVTIRPPDGVDDHGYPVWRDLWVSRFADGLAAEVLPSGLTAERLINLRIPLAALDRLFFDPGQLNTRELLELDSLPSDATNDAEAQSSMRWVSEAQYDDLVRRNPAVTGRVVARYPAGSVLWSPRYRRWLTGPEYAQLRLPDVGGQLRVVVLVAPLTPQAGGDEPAFIRDLSSANTTVVAASILPPDDPANPDVIQWRDRSAGSTLAGPDLGRLLASRLGVERRRGAHDMISRLQYGTDPSAMREELFRVRRLNLNVRSSGDGTTALTFRFVDAPAPHTIWDWLAGSGGLAVGFEDPADIAFDQFDGDETGLITLTVPDRYLIQYDARHAQVSYLMVDTTALIDDGFSAGWISGEGQQWSIIRPPHYVPDPPPMYWHQVSAPLRAAVYELSPWDGRSPDSVARVRRVSAALGVVLVVSLSDDSSGQDLAVAFGGAFVPAGVGGLAELRPGAATPVLVARPGDSGFMALVERQVDGQLVMWDPHGDPGERFLEFGVSETPEHRAALGLGPAADVAHLLPPALRGPVRLVLDDEGRLRQIMTADVPGTVVSAGAPVAPGTGARTGDEPGQQPGPAESFGRGRAAGPGSGLAGGVVA